LTVGTPKFHVQEHSFGSLGFGTLPHDSEEDVSEEEVKEDVHNLMEQYENLV